MFILFSASYALAQVEDEYTLSLEEFYAIVLSNHPVVRQALLVEDRAKQELRFSRGAFDPSFSTRRDFKKFNGANYWDLTDYELKVPVWFNTDLKINYQQGVGNYLPSEYENTEQGLTSVGISVPVGQGLFTDQRRAALQQAKIMMEFSTAEKVNLINNILLKATKDFWDWYFFYREYQIRLEAFDLATVRLNGVVENVLNGEQAVIDSVEAYILMQDRMVDRDVAEVNFINSGLDLSNYFWTDDGEPLEINQKLRPDMEDFMGILPEDDLNLLMVYAGENHPHLRKISAELSMAGVERRLAREMLKPGLNLNYNFLHTSGVTTIENPYFFDNNYKFGLDFQIPLFFRKERAKIGLTNIKISELEYKLNLKRREIFNEINATYNSMLNLARIVALQQELTENTNTLLEGELIKFENGESSIFLVNSRETKLVDTRSKLLKSMVSYEKEKFYLFWAAGNVEIVGENFTR